MFIAVIILLIVIFFLGALFSNEEHDQNQSTQLKNQNEKSKDQTTAKRQAEQTKNQTTVQQTSNQNQNQLPVQNHNTQYQNQSSTSTNKPNSNQLQTPPKQPIECKTNAKKKGKEGESIVAELLKDPVFDGCCVINNFLYLFKENGVAYKSFQVDHLVITSDRIFVIETKNYNNLNIFPTEDKEYWKLDYHSGNYTEVEYSHAMQNEIHIEKLKEVIGSNIPMVSVLAYVGYKYQLMYTPKPQEIILHKRNFIKRFKDVLDNKTDNASFSKVEIYNILSQLNERNIPGAEETHNKLADKIKKSRIKPLTE